MSLDLLEIEALPMSYVATKAGRRSEAALRRGFTTVRDVAGGDIGLRMALNQGLIDGPRYLFRPIWPDPPKIREPRRTA